MTPLQNYVIIAPIDKAKESSIILHESADLEPDNTGTVVAVGEKVTLPLKKGDEVLIKSHLFDVIDLGKKKFHLIGREDGIMAKL